MTSGGAYGIADVTTSATSYPAGNADVTTAASYVAGGGDVNWPYDSNDSSLHSDLSLFNFTLDDWLGNTSSSSSSSLSSTPAWSSVSTSSGGGGGAGGDVNCDVILADSAGPPPDYPAVTRWGVSAVLLLVPLLTMLGNVITILAVLTHRKLRTKTNAFIVSLAVADMCVSLLVMPFGIYQQVNSNVWELGDTLCRLSSSLDVMMCTVSIFHLSCMAVDRYLAICRPFLHERLTVRWIVSMLVCCWVVPVFISFLPILNGWNKLGIESYLACAFPPGSQSCVFLVNVPFAIVCSLIAFYIPVVFMGVCNAQIYQAAIKQAHQIRTLELAGTHNHHKKKKFHHEAKAAKTLGIIMGCFSVCWFPFFIMNIIDPMIGYRIPYIPWMVALWLGYINSMMNPLLYFFFNRHFNYAFRRLLRCQVCKGVRDYDDEAFTNITTNSD